MTDKAKMLLSDNEIKECPQESEGRFHAHFQSISDYILQHEHRPGNPRSKNEGILRASERHAAPREENICISATGTETILVVEDEPGVLSLIERVLKASGYTVHTAADGNDAFLKCELLGDTIQLMITDIVMPDMNGRELSERLLKFCPGMKVLYMSGYTENAILHHGVFDMDTNFKFISKPFALTDLTAKVREALDD